MLFIPQEIIYHHRTVRHARVFMLNFSFAEILACTDLLLYAGTHNDNFASI